jgi:GTP 3',8-cyclase
MTRDTFDRPLAHLRLSVTDRCNLRCGYCMPEAEYAWLPRTDLLSFEELVFLAERFATIGVDSIRLTGGEPLVRLELATLVKMLSSRPWLRDLALTTNGVLLSEQAQGLKDAGLKRITVSLDTLVPARFKALTRRDSHGAVLAGIHEAVRVDFPQGLKLDTVLVRGVNDTELVPLLDFAGLLKAELRFIEYMDVGGATQWNQEAVVSRAEVLGRLTQKFGRIEPIDNRGASPAERFQLPDGRIFGVIASTTQPFCGSCDRARVTADGTFFTCLYATTGLDLKLAMRRGESSETIENLIRERWTARRDRGAQERLAMRERGPLLSAEQLKQEPRLEMHTRGG